MLLVLCWYSATGATTVYDERINGDLPDPNAARPVLTASTGSNEVLGELGVYPDTADSFLLDLRNGLQLDAIIVSGFPLPANGYRIGFNLAYADSLRYLSVSEAYAGIDILPLLATLRGPGFSMSVANDVIEISLLQTLDRNAYGFDFVVSQVPLPAAFWLFASGLLGFAGIAGRR